MGLATAAWHILKLSPPPALCREDNVLVNAPHPADVVLADKWDKPYSRELAAFPAAWVRQSKFWPTTSRVDNVFGDRNLVARISDDDNTARAVAVGGN